MEQQEQPTVPPSSNRNIFRYFDGDNWVWGDPMEIHLALTYTLGGDPAKVVQETKNPDPGIAYHAYLKLAQGVRAAMQMQPYDKLTGTGATMPQCVEAWNAYLEHEEGLKKSIEQ